MPRILCVTAHPDDEAAAFGGSLRHYHEGGAETSVICLLAATSEPSTLTSETDLFAGLKEKD